MILQRYIAGNLVRGWLLVLLVGVSRFGVEIVEPGEDFILPPQTDKFARRRNGFAALGNAGGQ